MAKTDQTDSRTSKGNGQPQPTGKTGRPTVYSAAVAAAICERIALGSNLNQISNLDEFPALSTVYLWMQRHPEFSEMYARAREARADARADKIDQVCKDVEDGKLDFNKARVIIDALKWQAGKEKPRTYGDRITQEHTGPDGGPLQYHSMAEEELDRPRRRSGGGRLAGAGRAGRDRAGLNGAGRKRPECKDAIALNVV